MLTSKHKSALSIAGLVIALLFYLSASHQDYREDTYNSIPDSTLLQIYQRLDEKGAWRTKDQVLYEYQLIKEEQDEQSN